MAFCHKLGMHVRQNGQAPMASLYNSIRSMSQSKLFIGGLSYGTDDNSLKEAFSGFGEVTEARVITDRDTGRSRGFGFVSFSNDDSASSALSAMDGQELNGRNIRVSYAEDRRGGGSGGPRSYGGNNGGYGNNFGRNGGDNAY